MIPFDRCSFVAGHEYPENTRGKRCLRERHSYGVHVIGPEGCTVQEIGMVITIEMPPPVLVPNREEETHG